MDRTASDQICMECILQVIKYGAYCKLSEMDRTASDQRWTVLQVIRDGLYCKWSNMHGVYCKWSNM